MKKANIEDYFFCSFVQLRLGRKRCLHVKPHAGEAARLAGYRDTGVSFSAYLRNVHHGAIVSDRRPGSDVLV